MGSLWTVLALALHVWPGMVGTARAQGTRKDDIVFNSRGVPLAGASVRICAMPATGQPCGPLALIYSDAALTQAMANPTTTDGMGNYFFYAAPGRYEVEISGPGITNKQLPNVLLPSDPTSPTFTGAISAFSLTLSGNLTVNGNTTVVGSLASGTLNLANQGVPPGAASLGTVNLYTKTADKRLYYKDDTGAEVGPIASGSGAQTNVTNTFTAPQNFDADVHAKGPNPSYDLARYGLYSGAGAPITCNTTAGSATVACTSIGDFAVGQGIAIPQSGVAPAFDAWGTTTISAYSRSSNVATYTVGNTIVGPGQTITIAGLADNSFNGNYTIASNDGDAHHFTVANTGANVGTTAGSGTLTLTSSTVVVSPSGILNGTTRYDYKIVLRGYHGELSVASPAGTTTSGAATLGSNTINVSSCSRTSGLVSCTTSATHNLQSGVPVDLEGTSSAAYNGAHVIVSTPSATTFTFYQSDQANDSGPTGGTVNVYAKNTVRWNMQEYITLQAYVYRSTNSGAYSLAGIVEGMDGQFVDWGLGAPTAPGYISAGTPTAVTVNGILSAKITAINGNNLTLASAATATAASQSASHDNTPVVLAGCAAIGTNNSGTLLIPVTNTTVPFNSPLDLNNSCNVDFLSLSVGSSLIVNDPIILRARLILSAVPGGTGNQTPQLSMGFTNRIFGNAYPFLYLRPGDFGPTTVENFNLGCTQQYQSCVVMDQDSGSGGVVNDLWNNDYFVGNAGAMPFILRSGGFNHRWKRGGCYSIGLWGPPECMLIATGNSLGVGNQTLPGNMMFDQTQFSGKGVVYENWGQLNNAFPGYITFNDTLYENVTTPLIRYSFAASGSSAGLSLINAGPSDALNTASPVIDATQLASVSGSHIINPVCATNTQPLFAGSFSGSGADVSGSACSIGLSTYTARYGSGDAFVNSAVSLSGANGQVYYAMPVPAAPAIAASAGGGVPVGAHTYTVTAIDANGNTTTLSAGTAITVAGGTQTVTITPTLPTGAVGYRPYRDGGLVNFPGACGPVGPYIAGSTPFADTAGFTCSSTLVGSTIAAISSLGANGIAGPTLKLTGSGFVDTLNTPTMTASRTQSFPDVTGVVPVTSYLNTAYDNFNRANGAIGANWTVTNGGFNVASNVLVGTGASNLAYWAASPFSVSGQFSQVTVASLNGGTDYVGVDVLLSAGGNGYTCVENNATLLLQKITSGTGATLASSATAGTVGDVLRLEVSGAGNLTCSRSGTNPATVTFTDTTFTSGAPAVEIFGTVAMVDNWSGGNLHPLSQLDIEQDWTKTQHFGQGVAVGTETLSASPRAEQNIFLPGALTATWTGSTWTTDKAVTVTRVQVQAKTAPVGCTTNAVVRLTDGTTPVNVTIAAAANDSGSISQNYAAGAALQVVVQTAAAGCATSPADANVVVQYRMQ